MAFPPDLVVELWIDGAWVDITGDVRTSQDITIDRGRRDWGAYTDPGSCKLRLNNRHGRYSPRNPRSPLYGKIGRNTPIRVRVGEVPADTALLADSFDRTEASGWGTADTGQAWTTWTSMGAAAADYAVAGGAATMTVGSTFDDGWAATTDVGSADVDLTFTVATDTAAAGTSALGSILAAALLRADATAGTGYLLFVRMITDTGLPDGQGRRVGASITRLDGSGSYIDLSMVQTVPGLTYSEGVPLRARAQAVGSALRLKVWADGQPEPAAWHTQLYDDTYSTTVMGLYASAALVTSLPTTLSFGDLAISEPADETGVVRFCGEVTRWPPSWDLSGADHWVTLEAFGVLRRLTQGTDPLQSVMRRHIPTQWPQAYWPMEEGSRGDASVASAVDNTGVLRVSGLDFAQESSLTGSGPLPTVAGAARLISDPIPGVDTGSWSVSLMFRLPADSFPAAESEMLAFTTTGGYRWRVTIGDISGTNRLRLRVTDSDGTDLVVWNVNTDTAGVSITDQWLRLRVRAWQDGTDVRWEMTWVTVNNATWGVTDAFAGTAGRVSRIDTRIDAALKGMALGHLSTWGVYTDTGYTYYGYSVMAGMPYQYVQTYVQRLAAEEAIALDVIGASTTLIGAQPIDTWTALVQEAIASHMGVLTEQRDTIGLAMRTRDTLVNQDPAVTLDYSAGLIAALQPVEDDQGVHNDLTVKRRGGSEARMVLAEGPMSVLPPPDGIGRYTHQETVNLAYDNALPLQAGWRLRLATVDELRYPEVGVNLANPRMQPYIDALLAVDSGDVVRLTGLPDHLPPGDLASGDVDLMVQGYREILGAARWEIALVCTPASPWRMAVVGDAVLGKADTAGSELVDAAGEAETTLYVTTTSGPPWVVDPGEFPFDLRVGGEVVTATAATEAAEAPMPAAADSDTVSATSAVAPSVDAPGAADLLVCAWIPWDGLEAWAVPGAMTGRAQTTGVWSVLADATEVLAGAGATGTRTATRSTSAPWAAVSVVVTGAPVVVEYLDGVASDPLTGHAPGPVELTTSASTEAGWWLLALHGYDNDTTAPGPDGEGWTVLATTGSNGGSAPALGAWARRATGGAETVVFPEGDADDNHARLYVISGVTDLTAQKFTVIRSVNGVIKPHEAGADVRLAQPAIAGI
ncbi:hypothetical protein [Streptomyces sp. CNQ085]|uniref:hypothetical protein n=1 Tax=Streptomyces sp. CNQ085 TaxID=2886944 RepID=UPI001F512239|nr:hypothetical protein [Streptomyces sp. CNQ085]MCI0384594.1 hypothetical protein [Streptomyces sp. CNQ085]